MVRTVLPRCFILVLLSVSAFGIGEESGRCLTSQPRASWDGDRRNVTVPDIGPTADCGSDSLFERRITPPKLSWENSCISTDGYQKTTRSPARFVITGNGICGLPSDDRSASVVELVVANRRRSTMPGFNHILQFWDGRGGSLEDKRSADPTRLKWRRPMNTSLPKLGKIRAINNNFEPSSGTGSIYGIADAIAAYGRTVLHGIHSLINMCSVMQRPWMKLLVEVGPLGKGKAVYSVSQWAELTDNQFHNLGVPQKVQVMKEDLGQYNVSRSQTKDKGDIQNALPALRDCSPYMRRRLQDLGSRRLFRSGSGSNQTGPVDTSPRSDRREKPICW